MVTMLLLLDAIMTGSLSSSERRLLRSRQICLFPVVLTTFPTMCLGVISLKKGSLTQSQGIIRLTSVATLMPV